VAAISLWALRVIFARFRVFRGQIRRFAGGKESHVFVDYLKVHIKAGDGGHGCVAFRREAYVPRGGPAGGDGGRGGSVIFEADPKLGTLLDLKYRPRIVADRGGNGGGNDCHGRNGKDAVVRVPLGTTVTDVETGQQIADLAEPGLRWTAAKGGRGGFGNAHYATPRNKSPRHAQDGGPGEERHLILELKIIADIGLVGLPNAGKSTLLSKLSSATPKIAPYPFTTLSPNLGVAEYDDLFHLTLADIPGLIEGASRGAGLGDRFLRHIERTRILAHLICDEQGVFDPDDMLYKFDLVCGELKAYSDALARKPQIVIVTKIDLAKPGDLEKTCEAFRARGVELLCVSALTGVGLDDLKHHFRARAEADDETSREAERPAATEGTDQPEECLPTGETDGENRDETDEEEDNGLGEEHGEFRD
jgi:GTP-binding protein